MICASVTACDKGFRLSIYTHPRDSLYRKACHSLAHWHTYGQPNSVRNSVRSVIALCLVAERGTTAVSANPSGIKMRKRRC